MRKRMLLIGDRHVMALETLACHKQDHNDPFDRIMIARAKADVLMFVTHDYDLFPPMMFCMAASDWSHQYICSAQTFMRRGITADHPFIIWLLIMQ